MSESGQSAATMTKQEGLDASGFLLVGLGPLKKAMEIERGEDGSPYNSIIGLHIFTAIAHVKAALKLLKQEKEK